MNSRKDFLLEMAMIWSSFECNGVVILLENTLIFRHPCFKSILKNQSSGINVFCDFIEPVLMNSSETWTDSLDL